MVLYVRIVVGFVEPGTPQPSKSRRLEVCVMLSFATSDPIFGSYPLLSSSNSLLLSLPSSIFRQSLCEVQLTSCCTHTSERNVVLHPEWGTHVREEDTLDPLAEYDPNNLLHRLCFFLDCTASSFLGIFSGAYESLKVLSRADKGVETAMLCGILEFWSVPLAHCITRANELAHSEDFGQACLSILGL